MGNLSQEITPRKLKAIKKITVETGLFIAIRVSAIIINIYNINIKCLLKYDLLKNNCIL